MIKTRIRCSGGGSDGPDINAVSKSQAALWSTEAKKWNKYLRDIEPRQDAAFKTALEDPTDMYTGAIKGAVYDKYSPTKAFESSKPVNTKQFMGGASALGGALAEGEVLGTELAKDYKQKTLSDIAATIMGEKVNQGQSMGSLASGEAKSFVDNLSSKRSIDSAWNKAGSSALGSLVTGGVSGVLDPTTAKAGK